MSLRCIFHVHTKFSFDSWLSPLTIISRARDSHTDILLVTDHNSIRGSAEVARLAQGNPKHVVVGGEYKTEKGDIIGLFLTNEITSRQSDEVIREIKQQGGIVILPHPYKGHLLDETLLAKIDLVETLNARCSFAENCLAEELGRRLDKPSFAGCDAHCAEEIGSAIMEFSAAPPTDVNQLRSILLMAPRKIHVRKVARVYQPLSQMIKALKTRDVWLLFSQVKAMASILAKDVFSL